MKTLTGQEFLDTFSNEDASNDSAMVQNVLDIIDQVKEKGDRALIDLTERFDGEKLESLKVPQEKLQAAYEHLDQELKEALEIARDRIVAYEKQIKYQDRDLGEFSYRYHPLKRVGVYVPGGTALYPSSVLMSVVAAQVAGVEEIHVTTPTFAENNVTFATLHLLGIDNVYSIGGAQAVAALAYGTETIPKVDKIVGPGNAYVAVAKRLVYGEVGIDSIAGPSEILLTVDDSVELDDIVYDLFAQAEHDPNARTFLLAEDQGLIQKIQDRVHELLPDQARKDIIHQSLANNHYSITDDLDQLIEIINYIAPEHVSIQHRKDDYIIDRIKYAGAVFQGRYSAEAIGDYIAGPSHVLPTNRTGRFSHGLNVNDFLTSHAVINLDKETYMDVVGPAKTIAKQEGLLAHYDSLASRED